MKSAGLIFCPPSPREQCWMIAIEYMSSTLSPGGRGQKQDRQISQKIENFGIVWRCPYDFAHPIFLFPHKAGLDFGRQRRPKQDRPISMKHYLMGAFMLGWRCLQRVFFIVLRRSLCMRGCRCLQRFIFLKKEKRNKQRHAVVALDFAQRSPERCKQRHPRGCSGLRPATP